MFDTLFLAATNHLLGQSTWARKRLQPHAGRRALLNLAPFSVQFSIAEGGELAACTSTEQADVTLDIPLAESGRLIGGGIDALMSQVRISGNAEFADALGFVFRHLRWDLEDDLSRLVGDIAAHRIVTTGQAFGKAQQRALQGVVGNVVEYVTEEQAMLLGRGALPGIDADIRALRDAIARLEKRVDRLEKA